MTQMTHTITADKVSLQNMSGTEWPSIKWLIQAEEIIYPKVSCKIERLVKSYTLTRRFTFTAAIYNYLHYQQSGCISSKTSIGARILANRAKEENVL